MNQPTVPDIIAWKRDGHAFDEPMIQRFIEDLLRGDVAPEQVGAWLMACQINGLTAEETALLTKPLWTRNGWLWKGRTRRTRSWKRMSITWARV